MVYIKGSLLQHICAHQLSLHYSIVNITLSFTLISDYNLCILKPLLNIIFRITIDLFLRILGSGELLSLEAMANTRSM